MGGRRRRWKEGASVANKAMVKALSADGNEHAPTDAGYVEDPGARIVAIDEKKIRMRMRGEGGGGG